MALLHLDRHLDKHPDKHRQIRTLAERLHRLEAHPSSALLDTLPALAPLFPAGSLRTGSVYSVIGSTALATALMAGPARAGAWCGVVGVPTFGVEAAIALGIDANRLVLIPDPGQSWVQVLAACIDVLGVVLLAQPRRVHDAEAARLNGRLRERGSALVVLGDWPRSEARLRITESSWAGIGSGYGYLRTRQVTVTAEARTGRSRSTTFWLTHPERQPERLAGSVDLAEPVRLPQEAVG